MGLVSPSGRKNQMIMVNLKQCHFQFFKPGDSQRQTYEHSQLLQLVKSRSRDSRLGVVFQGQSRKEYIFNDMQVRGAGREGGMEEGGRERGRRDGGMEGRRGRDGWKREGRRREGEMGDGGSAVTIAFSSKILK